MNLSSLKSPLGHRPAQHAPASPHCLAAAPAVHHASVKRPQAALSAPGAAFALQGPVVAAPSSCTPQHQMHPTRCVATRATSSVDPMSKEDGVYRPGRTFIIHSPDELKSFLDTHKLPKDKLVILEAKSSHCRPCKKFAATYNQLAERFRDCVFLEVIGDESPTTRRMMVDMKVKSTPTFFLYRNGELLTSFSGIKNDALKNAILERLRPDEAGRDWVEPEEDDDEDEED